MSEKAHEVADERRRRLELELLVTRCQLGVPEALDALVARWHGPLWRYALAMTGRVALAEEVVQDAWLRILRGLGGLREPASLRPWMFSILRRSFMDRLRERYDEPPAEPGAEPASPPLHDDPVWDEIAALRAAIPGLPAREREAVLLFYLRELDLAEVARVLEVPPGTVKSRLHRARRLLRAALEGGAENERKT